MLLIFAPERAAASRGISAGKERAAGVQGVKKNIYFPIFENKVLGKSLSWSWCLAIAGWGPALAGSLGRDIDLIVALNTKPVLTVLN